MMRVPMDRPIISDSAHTQTDSFRPANQSDPDSQTVRFQGRNTGNGCSVACFLRRNTDLGSSLLPLSAIELTILGN